MSRQLLTACKNILLAFVPAKTDYIRQESNLSLSKLSLQHMAMDLCNNISNFLVQSINKLLQHMT